ncbi:hypothetical protein BCR34DRAFT_636074, partial [Clohesyomyces aquaticus]
GIAGVRATVRREHSLQGTVDGRRRSRSRSRAPKGGYKLRFRSNSLTLFTTTIYYFNNIRVDNTYPTLTVLSSVFGSLELKLKNNTSFSVQTTLAPQRTTELKTQTTSPLTALHTIAKWRPYTLSTMYRPTSPRPPRSTYSQNDGTTTATTWTIAATPTAQS